MATKIYIKDYQSGLSLSSGDTVYVLPGGTIEKTTLDAHETAVLSSGALASDSIINPNGGLHVFSGAVADTTLVNQNGYFGVGLGATVSNTTIGTFGALTVWGGGKAVSNTINSKGSLILSSGAVADHSVINPGGGLHVFSGAVASNTTVEQAGYFGVGLGATVYNTTIGTFGALTVWGGGKAVSNTINSKGSIILSSGAVADHSVINSSGGLHVFSGAAASNTTVNQSGFFGVGLGASTYNTTIGYAGSLTVWGGGKVETNTIGTWGSLILSSGATANQTQINQNGGLHIYSGATAYSTVINEGATLGIGKGGTVYHVNCEYGASMVFYAGSMANGYFDIAGTMTVLGTLDASKCIFVFDISDYFSCSSPILNSSEALRGGSYRIQVNDVIQNRGSYLIAANAQNFKDVVSLVNESNEMLGTLRVNGEEITAGNTSYALSCRNGNLFLDVSHIINPNSVKLHENNAVISSASSMSNVLADSNKTLIVADGGKISDTTVTSGGILSIANGAYADRTTVNNGGYAAADGGFYENTVIKSGATFVIKNNAMAKDTVLHGGLILIQNSAVVWNTDVRSGAQLIVESNGIAKDTEIGSGVYLKARNSGSAVNIHIQDGGHVIAEENGFIRTVTAASGANVSIQEGASGCNVKLEDGAAAYITGGAYISGLECLGTYNRMDLHVTRDTYIQFVSKGKSYEIRDGVADGILVDVETYLRLSSGVVGKNLHTTGFVVPERPVDGNGGVIHVSEGGLALDVDNHASAVVTVMSGGKISRYIGDTESELYLTGGSAYGMTVSSAGYLWVHSGSLAEDVKLVNDGRLTISSGGHASNVLIDNSYALVEEYNAYLTDAVLTNGGQVKVCGGNADRIVVESGAVLTFSNGFTVMDGPTLQTSNGQARDVVVNKGGLLSIQLTGSATRVTANSGGVVTVDSSSELIQYEGKEESYAAVSRGGILRNADIASGATLNISAGSAYDVTVRNGGTIVLSSESELNGYHGYESSFASANNAKLENINIHSGAGFHLKNGVTGTGIKVNAGGNLYLTFDNNMNINGTVDGTDFSGASGTLSGYRNINGNLVLESGTTGNNIQIASGYVTVQKGANISSATLQNGVLWISGTANTVTIESGNLTMYSGASGNNVQINSGYVTVQKGANISSATLQNGGLLISGTANTVTTESGNLTIYSGASGNDVQINGGYVTVQKGANITSATLQNGVLLISGTANTVTTESGNLTIYSGASGNDVQINGGYVTVQKGANITSAALRDGTLLISGTANDLTLTGGTGAILYSGGLINGLTVNSTGNILTVKNGAMVTGNINIQSGTFYAEQSAVINMDISRLTGTSVSLPCIKGLDSILGDTTFRITVSSAQQFGNYVLAEYNSDSFNFTKGVTLFENGVSFGTLYADSNVISRNGRNYSMNQTSSGYLTLAVSDTAERSADSALFEETIVDLNVPGCNADPVAACAMDLTDLKKDHFTGWLA